MNKVKVLLFVLATLSAVVAYSQNANHKTFSVNGVSFKMIYVPAGSFTMGATLEQGIDVERDEFPSHKVNLNGYYIGQTEVTQALWTAVMGKNPSENTESSLNPVEMVSWEECVEFISKLNALTGENFRLPTEAEWEYAARGGSRSQGYKYSGGNLASEVAWCGSSYGGNTRQVAKKKPNELGLYDMSGNVWEWCSDWYAPYEDKTQSNPQGAENGEDKVYRGGSGYYSELDLRVSARYKDLPSWKSYDCGLRLAL